MILTLNTMFLCKLNSFKLGLKLFENLYSSHQCCLATVNVQLFPWLLL